MVLGAPVHADTVALAVDTPIADRIEHVVVQTAVVDWGQGTEGYPNPIQGAYWDIFATNARAHNTKHTRD